MKKKLRKALALSVALVFTVMSFVAFPVLDVHAAAVTPETGNIYYIKNKNSGLYLTVENDSSAAGANVVQATGTGSLGHWASDGFLKRTALQAITESTQLQI